MTSASLFHVARLFCSITMTAFALMSSDAYSAERIHADVVSDIDFISPGETVAIQVRLENPADSGTVISQAHFKFQRAEMQQLQEFHFLDIIDSTGCSLTELTNMSLGLKRACETTSNDVFPVNPGGSVLLTYRYMTVSEDAPPGTIIQLENITLRMFDPDDRRLPDVYLERDVVRVVGDPGATQTLPKLDTANPMAGSANLNMTLTLKYPERVNAGDPFIVEATLDNHSNEQFTAHTQLSLHAIGVGSSYQARSCGPAFPCDGARISIGPLESIEGIKFNVEHESAVRQLGFWDVSDPQIHVFDGLGREAVVYAEPVRVVIDHYTHLPTLTPRP